MIFYIQIMEDGADGSHHNIAFCFEEKNPYCENENQKMNNINI